MLEALRVTLENLFDWIILAAVASPLVVIGFMFRDRSK